jgi:hypothetical protein
MRENERERERERKEQAYLCKKISLIRNKRTNETSINILMKVMIMNDDDHDDDA